MRLRGALKIEVEIGLSQHVNDNGLVRSGFRLQSHRMDMQEGGGLLQV